MVLVAVYALHIGHPGFLGQHKPAVLPAMTEEGKA